MTDAVSIRRKNRFNVLREAPKLASFDEFPMLRPEVDPQVHLSRNLVDQPFYLVCEKDTVVAQFTGASRIDLKESSVRYFDVGEGDHVYVPAGVPHRILTRATGDVIRYKAREPGVEAVLWYCDRCDEELDRYVWNNADTIPQAAYQAACERHNASPERRSCKTCGKEQPLIDLTPFRWARIAEALSQPEEEDA